jgi:hypothetical protein
VIKLTRLTNQLAWSLEFDHVTAFANLKSTVLKPDVLLGTPSTLWHWSFLIAVEMLTW